MAAALRRDIRERRAEEELMLSIIGAADVFKVSRWLRRAESGEASIQHGDAQTGFDQGIARMSGGAAAADDDDIIGVSRHGFLRSPV